MFDREDHLMRTPSVTIVEVAPRDGLQNEPVHVDTPTKIELVERAVAAGINRVEVTSFVNPKRVPQMADADAVVAGLATRDGVSHIGLAMNEQGVHRAIAAGVDEINFVVVTTDTFNRRNQGVPTFESIAVLSAMTTIVREHGLLTSVTVAASFGCPYEGEVKISRLLDVVERVVATEPNEIALADTIGVAAPSDVSARLDAVRGLVGNTPLRCHFHNTRNTGLANAYAAVEAGVESLDASIGGVGGCPFAPEATGNIPTEDLVYMLDRMGVITGVDLTKVIEIARWLEDKLDKPLPGMLHRVDPFPGIDVA